ncbi:MAG: hypothetical protein WEB58_03805 [Planctomycetaceae bacterium]
MPRCVQLTFLASFLALCWLAFLAVHELGHVLTAWMTGGVVSYVVLHPLKLSMTVLADNPHPGCVGWGGPVFGILAPFCSYAIANALRSSQTHLFRFFCGFCCVGNGVYLLVDAFAQSGDGATLIHAGTAKWAIVLFGSTATPAGFWLWHGQSRHFGFGRAARKIEAGDAIVSVLLLIGVTGLELACSGV